MAIDANLWFTTNNTNWKQMILHVSDFIFATEDRFRYNKLSSLHSFISAFVILNFNKSFGLKCNFWIFSSSPCAFIVPFDLGCNDINCDGLSLMFMINIDLSNCILYHPYFDNCLLQLPHNLLYSYSDLACFRFILWNFDSIIILLQLIVLFLSLSMILIVLLKIVVIEWLYSILMFSQLIIYHVILCLHR